MSLFRIGGSAGLRATRLVAPVNARFNSSAVKGAPAIKTTPADAPTTPPKDSSLINKESPSEAMTRHQPDYDATIDHGTSYVTSHWPLAQSLSLTLISLLSGNSPQFPSVSWMAVSQERLSLRPSSLVHPPTSRLVPSGMLATST